MPVFLPNQEAALGQVIDHDGKQLVVDKEFVQGKDAKASSYQFFLNSPKGVFGLKEADKPKDAPQSDSSVAVSEELPSPRKDTSDSLEANKTGS